MANSGPNTNGSQFFITHKATPWLDDRHTVFGKLVSGEDVLDSIAGVEVDPANNRPLVTVTIKKLNIIRNGKEARNFDAVSIMETYFEEEEEREAAREKMKADIVSSLPSQSETVERTESGLGILTLTEGSGAKPENGQYVLVNYSGWLEESGELFDSNIKDMATLFDKFNHQRDAQGGYQPLPFEYSTESKVIPGFREGLLSMKVGDKKRFFIPSHLGYGEQGAGGGLIPPNADLVFEVEILDIYEQPASGGSGE
jgi:FKBP-type peptidyl-prolyl cis-trans isomerase